MYKYICSDIHISQTQAHTHAHTLCISVKGAVGLSNYAWRLSPPTPTTQLHRQHL